MPSSVGDLKYNINSFNPFPSYDTQSPISLPTSHNKVSNIWKYFFSFASYYTHRASLVAQLVKNLPAMQETSIWFLGQENTLEKGMATHSRVLAWRILMDGGTWWAAVYGVTQSQTWLKRLSSSSSTVLYCTSPISFRRSCPPLMGTLMSLGSKWWQSWIRKRLKPGEFWKHHLKELYEEEYSEQDHLDSFQSFHTQSTHHSSFLEIFTFSVHLTS